MALVYVTVLLVICRRSESTDARLQSGRPVIVVEGFDSITEAEALLSVMSFECRCPSSRHYPTARTTSTR